MLGILSLVDMGLATQVAYNLGLSVPKPEIPINKSIPADGDPVNFEPVIVKSSLDKSLSLSMVNTIKDSIKSRKIAVLAADGADAAGIDKIRTAILAGGGVCEVIAPKLGSVIAEDDTQIPVQHSLLTAASVLYDAVYVAGGVAAVATLESSPDAVHFINEAYKHCKAIAADEDARQVLEATYFRKKLTEKKIEDGVLIGETNNAFVTSFIKAIAQHRFWEREKPRKIPA